ncbi:arsenite efflux ATP-binding protein ArsA [Jatrophihabitans endophyticus]|uniref:Arsenite efflux ATP-binding protein ArsA n=1 Tax=Jatrophihabitans endophyticus TaxID=1206085 RepID=A0A1M5H414_9ACTN|nr:ArsA-related P-loop ATPase [Jatrophihabitans endophyticus]SHG10749.1 arsenite efflux ATP-binding protein ArsA [Jatrophihabitans endophyticus]
MTAPFDALALVRDPATRVVVTCGSGGVGKTTTAAALGLAGAAAGRRTVVLTIDPARRLAQSLGLTELDNTPREVTGVFEGDAAPAGGALFAMMLDMKRTFDDVVLENSTPERAEQIFANPFYQSLSSSFAGTQEYMAMEKLGQLVATGEWDLVVVDTPPSRSALDFLDAPNRLGRFLDGRMIKLLSAPAKAGGKAYLKVVTVGVGMVARVFTKVIGGDLLNDLSTFVTALESMFGGFRERADQTYQRLKAPGTAFVVVAAPEPDALREASYFVDRLRSEAMPLAGVVVNRTRRSSPVKGRDPLTAAQAQVAADAAGNRTGADLAVTALRVHVEVATAAEHDVRMTRRFASAHPDVPLVGVSSLPTDVHDLEGLREIGRLLGS